jgi:hypothetical protein
MTMIGCMDEWHPIAWSSGGPEVATRDQLIRVVELQDELIRNLREQITLLEARLIVRAQ